MKLDKRNVHMWFFHKLTQNGWLWQHEYDDDLGAYVLTLIGEHYETKCIAKIASNDDNLGVCGHFGVGYIEVEYENDAPHGWVDLADMQEAIKCAEMNLLQIGVPFCDNTDFHGTDEEVAEKSALNTKIRKELNLLEIEKELGWGKDE